MKKYILPAILGFATHAILLIGDTLFSENPKFNILRLYDSLLNNDNGIFLSALLALSISTVLTLFYYKFLESRRIKINETLNLFCKETVSFFIGSFLAYIGLHIFIWWAFKDFLSFS